MRLEGWAATRLPTGISVLAARSVRVFTYEPPSNEEGAGNAGCPMDPRPPVQQKAQASATTGSPETSGGFNRSSQHSRYGGCAAHSKEAINTGPAGLVGTTAGCRAC